MTPNPIEFYQNVTFHRENYIESNTSAYTSNILTIPTTDWVLTICKIIKRLKNNWYTSPFSYLSSLIFYLYTDIAKLYGHFEQLSYNNSCDVHEIPASKRKIKIKKHESWSEFSYFVSIN